MIYEVLKIPDYLEKPYGAMSKEGAKAFFKWLSEIADSRIQRFIEYVEVTSDGKIKLNFLPDTLLELGEWLKSALQVRKRTEAEMNEILAPLPDWLKESTRENDTVLTEESLSFCFDLAFYFSKLMMKADGRIGWEMHTKASKLDADRNQLVLNGFIKGIYCNPIRSMEIVGKQLAEGREGSDALLKLFNIWMEDLPKD